MIEQADSEGTLESRLIGQREQIRQQAASWSIVFDQIVEASDDVATDDEHDPEGHTIAFERQQVAALLRDARAQLSELDAALDRLHEGRYGRCVECGEWISAARLEALPATQRCIACAV